MGMGMGGSQYGGPGMTSPGGMGAPMGAPMGGPPAQQMAI